MYIEFVIGYVFMGVLALLLAILIFLACIILKRLPHDSMLREKPYDSNYNESAYTRKWSVAVCRNCATQFDVAHSVCPKCGTPR